MTPGYLPPHANDNVRNTLLQAKIQRLEQENDALRLTNEGLTQFICAIAYEHPFKFIGVSAPSLNRVYTAQWTTYPDRSIAVTVEEKPTTE